MDIRFLSDFHSTFRRSNHLAIGELIRFSIISRVDGVKRSITPNLIRNTRMMQLRKEALNSSKLKMHFEDNPHELELLQHGISKRLVRPIAYLRDIPDYLIPDALKPKSNPEEAKRNHEDEGKNKEWKRKRVVDPLHVLVNIRFNV